MRRNALVVAAALAVLALSLAFALPAFAGSVHTLDDMGRWYVPMRAFYARCLERGDAFDWVPDVYCGYYLQGDGQVGMYHPVHWLLYRALPLATAVNVEMLLGFALLASGVYALARRWRLARGPALFAALAVGFSGYGLRHFEHLNATQVLGHVPWMLVLVDTALRSCNERTARAAALGVGWLTLSELLIGYPQYFWFSSLAEACYVACVLPSRPPLRRLAWLAAAKALGVVGGAIQLLPTADLLGSSVRTAMTAAERSQWPWHPMQVAGLVAPYLFEPKNLASFDPGVVAIALVAWLLVRRGVTRARRTIVLGALGVALLTAWLALGEYGLLYRLHLELPVIGVFRMPYRYLSLTGIAFGMLAAIALHELAKTATRRPRAGRPFLLVLPALGALVVGATWLIDGTDRARYVERHLGSYPLACGGIALLAVAAWLVHRAERGARWALGALVLLAALDLGVHGLRFVYRGGWPTTLAEYAAAVPVPPDENGRAVAAVANQLVFHEVRITGGYMPLEPDAPFLLQIDEHGPRSLPHLRVANVRWVQDEATGDAWTQKAFSIDGLRAQSRVWHPVPDPLPRARLVAAAVVSATPVAATAGVDVARVAVVEKALALDGGAPGTAAIAEDRPGRIAVDVRAPGRQLLVVGERHVRGWRATVDGAPRDVVRVYGGFLGCEVDAASRRVELEFAPDSLRDGTRWTLAASALLVLASAWVAFAPRRGTPRSSAAL